MASTRNSLRVHDAENFPYAAMLGADVLADSFSCSLCVDWSNCGLQALEARKNWRRVRELREIATQIGHSSALATALLPP
jgi:hypothetical protein